MKLNIKYVVESLFDDIDIQDNINNTVDNITKNITIFDCDTVDMLIDYIIRKFNLVEIIKNKLQELFNTDYIVHSTTLTYKESPITYIISIYKKIIKNNNGLKYKKNLFYIKLPGRCDYEEIWSYSDINKNEGSMKQYIDKLNIELLTEDIDRKIYNILYKSLLKCSINKLLLKISYKDEKYVEIGDSDLKYTKNGVSDGFMYTLLGIKNGNDLLSLITGTFINICEQNKTDITEYINEYAYIFVYSNINLIGVQIPKYLLILRLLSYRDDINLRDIITTYRKYKGKIS